MSRRRLTCPPELVAGLYDRPLRETAELAGVSITTVHRWRQGGRKRASGPPPSEEPPKARARRLRTESLRERAVALRADGVSYTDIGYALDVSGEYVRRLLHGTDALTPAQATVRRREVRQARRWRRIQPLWGRGLTDWQIGPQLGMSESTVKQVRLRAGAAANGPRRFSCRRKRAYTLRASTGATWATVAATLGYANATVACTAARKYAQRAGAPWPAPVLAEAP